MLPNIYVRVRPIGAVCPSVAASRRYALSAKFQTGANPGQFVKSGVIGFDSAEWLAQHEIRNGFAGLAHADTLAAVTRTRHAAGTVRDPLTQQGGLPKPGRRGDQGQLVRHEGRRLDDVEYQRQQGDGQRQGTAHGGLSLASGP